MSRIFNASVTTAFSNFTNVLIQSKCTLKIYFLIVATLAADFAVFLYLNK